MSLGGGGGEYAKQNQSMFDFLKLYATKQD